MSKMSITKHFENAAAIRQLGPNFNVQSGEQDFASNLQLQGLMMNLISNMQNPYAPPQQP
jgi:hypothetical protein